MLKRFVLIAFLSVPFAAAVFAEPPAGDGQMLAHNVYFTLRDRSEAAQARLIADCQKYLKAHPGVVFFAAGRVAGDLNREVNDRDFDVALHLVFRSRADHDRYQAHAMHKKFIEENQANWARVRVFDSYVK